MNAGEADAAAVPHVLAVWNDGNWAGSHPKFHKAVAAKMPPTQSPNYNPFGAPEADFEQQTPLTVERRAAIAVAPAISDGNTA